MLEGLCTSIDTKISPKIILLHHHYHHYNTTTESPSESSTESPKEPPKEPPKESTTEATTEATTQQIYGPTTEPIYILNIDGNISNRCWINYL